MRVERFSPGSQPEALTASETVPMKLPKPTVATGLPLEWTYLHTADLHRGPDEQTWLWLYVVRHSTTC